jgi:hypothetical protein
MPQKADQYSSFVVLLYLYFHSRVRHVLCSTPPKLSQSYHCTSNRGGGWKKKCLSLMRPLAVAVLRVSIYNRPTSQRTVSAHLYMCQSLTRNLRGACNDL